MGKVDDIQAYREWGEYYRALKRDTAIDDLSDAERRHKLRRLENDPVEWISFFFAEYTRYPFTRFHRKAIRRISAMLLSAKIQTSRSGRICEANSFCIRSRSW